MTPKNSLTFLKHHYKILKYIPLAPSSSSLRPTLEYGSLFKTFEACIRSLDACSTRVNVTGISF